MSPRWTCSPFLTAPAMTGPLTCALTETMSCLTAALSVETLAAARRPVIERPPEQRAPERSASGNSAASLRNGRGLASTTSTASPAFASSARQARPHRFALHLVHAFDAFLGGSRAATLSHAHAIERCASLRLPPAPCLRTPPRQARRRVASISRPSAAPCRSAAAAMRGGPADRAGARPGPPPPAGRRCGKGDRLDIEMIGEFDLAKARVTAETRPARAIGRALRQASPRAGRRRGGWRDRSRRSRSGSNPCGADNTLTY